MKLVYTATFNNNILKFPLVTRNKFYKQASYLILNLRHPSLHAKKYDEVSSIWQARVDKSIRFYFIIQGNSYILLDIKRHPK